MKKINSTSRAICTLMFVVLLSTILLNCDCRDDDDTEVSVCNLDNHEYDVELRRHSDDSVEDMIHLDEWYQLGDQCDSFKDIDEGRYYLVVLDDDRIMDESDDFYLDEGELEVFEIDGSGDIINNFDNYDVTLVRVCNSDDDDYRVELKRSSDDSLVADFDLEQGHDFADQCDKFFDLDEGGYYIEIFEEGNNIVVDRSNDFIIESHRNLNCTINKNGYLVEG